MTIDIEKLLREDAIDFVYDVAMYIEHDYDEVIEELRECWKDIDCEWDPVSFVLAMILVSEKYDFAYEEKFWDELNNNETFKKEVSEIISTEDIDISVFDCWNIWCSYGQSVGLRKSTKGKWNNNNVEYHESNYYKDICLMGSRFSNDGFQGDHEVSGSATVERHHAHNVFKIAFYSDNFHAIKSNQKVYYFEAEEYDEEGRCYWGTCTVPLDDVFDGVAGFGRLGTLWLHCNDEEE